MKTDNQAREGILFLGSAAGKGVLLVGLDVLTDGGAAIRAAYATGFKAHKNWAVIRLLDGQQAEIRLNAAETAWVVDFASPRRATMFAWTSGPSMQTGRGGNVRHAGPRLEYTNGGAWCCGIVNAQVATARGWTEERAGATLDLIRQGMVSLAERGMTPMQWRAAESAAANRRSAVASALWEAKEADYTLACAAANASNGDIDAARAWLRKVADEKAATEAAGEEARIMAELEAEQAVAIAAQQAAAAAEKQSRENAAAGVTSQMTPKQARIAIHNARLAGKI
jgi:hypothetical protein